MSGKQPGFIGAEPGREPGNAATVENGATRFEKNQEVSIRLHDGTLQKGTVLGSEGGAVTVGFFDEKKRRDDFLEISATELAALQTEMTNTSPEEPTAAVADTASLAADTALERPLTAAEMVKGAEVWIKTDAGFVKVKIDTIGKGLVHIEGQKKTFRVKSELVPWQIEHAEVANVGKQEEPKTAEPKPDDPEAAKKREEEVGRLLGTLDTIVADFETYKKGTAKGGKLFELTATQIEALEELRKAIEAHVVAVGDAQGLGKNAKELSELEATLSEKGELTLKEGTAVARILTSTPEKLFGKRKVVAPIATPVAPAPTPRPPAPQPAPKVDDPKKAEVEPPAEPKDEPEPVDPTPRDPQTILAESTARYRDLAESSDERITIRLNAEERNAANRLEKYAISLLRAAKRENRGVLPPTLNEVARALNELDEIKAKFRDQRLPTNEKKAAAHLFAEAVSFLLSFVEDPERFVAEQADRIEQEKMQRPRENVAEMRQWDPVFERLEAHVDEKKADGSAHIFSKEDIMLGPARIEAIQGVITAGEYAIAQGLAEPLAGTPLPDTKRLQTELPKLKDLLAQYTKGELEGKPAKDFVEKATLVYSLVRDTIDRDDLRSADEIRDELADLADEHEEDTATTGRMRKRLTEINQRLEYLIGWDGKSGTYGVFRHLFKKSTEKVTKKQGELRDAYAKANVRTQTAEHAFKERYDTLKDTIAQLTAESAKGPLEEEKAKILANAQADFADGQTRYGEVFAAIEAVRAAVAESDQMENNLKHLEPKIRALQKEQAALLTEDVNADGKLIGSGEGLGALPMTHAYTGDLSETIRSLENTLYPTAAPSSKKGKATPEPKPPKPIPVPADAEPAEPEPIPPEPPEAAEETPEEFTATLEERMGRDPAIKPAMEAFYEEWLGGAQDDPVRTRAVFDKHTHAVTKPGSELFQELDTIEGVFVDNDTLHTMARIWLPLFEHMRPAPRMPDLAPDEARNLLESFQEALKTDEEDTIVFAAFFEAWHKTKKTDADAVRLYTEYIHEGTHGALSDEMLDVYLPSVDVEHRLPQLIRAWEPFFPDKEATQKEKDQRFTAELLNMLEARPQDKAAFTTFFDSYRANGRSKEDAYFLLSERLMDEFSDEFMDKLLKEEVLAGETAENDPDALAYKANGNQTAVDSWYRIVQLLEPHFPVAEPQEPEAIPSTGADTESAPPERKEFLPVKSAELTERAKKKELSNEKNEDCFFAHDRLGLYGVFDGMGGHAAGDVASREALDFVMNYLVAHHNPDADPAETEKQLAKALLAANNHILELQKQPGYKGMGTTASVMKICELADGKRVAIVANAGDSRVYKQHADGTLEAITMDDAMALSRLPKEQQDRIQKILSTGNTRDEMLGMTSDPTEQTNIAHAFGNRNGVSQYIGYKKGVLPKTYQVPLEKGDRLLLTSDGIHDPLTDPEIEKILRNHTNLEDAVAALLAATKRKNETETDRDAGKRGKDDDKTAILIEAYPEDAPTAAPATGGSDTDANPDTQPAPSELAIAAKYIFAGYEAKIEQLKQEIMATPNPEPVDVLRRDLRNKNIFALPLPLEADADEARISSLGEIVKAYRSYQALPEEVIEKQQRVLEPIIAQVADMDTRGKEDVFRVIERTINEAQTKLLEDLTQTYESNGPLLNALDAVDNLLDRDAAISVRLADFVEKTIKEDLILMGAAIQAEKERTGTTDHDTQEKTIRAVLEKCSHIAAKKAQVKKNQEAAMRAAMPPPPRPHPDLPLPVTTPAGSAERGNGDAPELLSEKVDLVTNELFKKCEIAIERKLAQIKSDTTNDDNLYVIREIEEGERGNTATRSQVLSIIKKMNDRGKMPLSKELANLLETDSLPEDIFDEQMKLLEPMLRRTDLTPDERADVYRGMLLATTQAASTFYLTSYTGSINRILNEFEQHAKDVGDRSIGFLQSVIKKGAINMVAAIQAEIEERGREIALYAYSEPDLLQILRRISRLEAHHQIRKEEELYATQPPDDTQGGAELPEGFWTDPETIREQLAGERRVLAELMERARAKDSRPWKIGRATVKKGHETTIREARLWSDERDAIRQLARTARNVLDEMVRNNLSVARFKERKDAIEADGGRVSIIYVSDRTEAREMSQDIIDGRKEHIFEAPQPIIDFAELDETIQSLEAERDAVENDIDRPARLLMREISAVYKIITKSSINPT